MCTCGMWKGNLLWIVLQYCRGHCYIFNNSPCSWPCSETPKHNRKRKKNPPLLSSSAQVGVSSVARSTNMGTAPVEDMQALSITTLSALEVEQQYELIGPLGKGTYGRVDLVAHRTQGKCENEYGIGVFKMLAWETMRNKTMVFQCLGP